MKRKESEQKTIIKRLEELATLINKHNYFYHTKDQPQISDDEYDKLVKENLELESKFPELTLKISPSNKVGGKIQNKFKKSNHLSSMYSLANGFNEKDLIEFDERIKKFLNLKVNKKLEYICEPKIDGLSLNLTYKNGTLISAATRGDGKVGEDVTKNITNIKNIPQKLKNNYPDLIEIRGEVFITKSDFKKINSKHKISFSKGIKSTIKFYNENKN